VPITLFNSNLTLEPEPSITSAPTACNNDSIRRHSRVLDTGFRKIAFNVFWCVLFRQNIPFIQYMISKNDIIWIIFYPQEYMELTPLGKRQLEYLGLRA